MTHPKGHVRRPVITFIITTVLTTTVILWKLLHDLSIPRP